MIMMDKLCIKKMIVMKNIKPMKIGRKEKWFLAEHKGSL